MKKKVYIESISLDEILQRLNAGQRLYSDIAKFSYQVFDNFIVKFENDIATEVGMFIDLEENNKYFIDDVPWSEADESCEGKLCEFWNDNGFDKYRGILTTVSSEKGGLNFFQDGGAWYNHCRPLTAEEAKKYIKE